MPVFRRFMRRSYWLLLFKIFPPQHTLRWMLYVLVFLAFFPPGIDATFFPLDKVYPLGCKIVAFWSKENSIDVAPSFFEDGTLSGGDAAVLIKKDLVDPYLHNVFFSVNQGPPPCLTSLRYASRIHLGETNVPLENSLPFQVPLLDFPFSFPSQRRTRLIFLGGKQLIPRPHSEASPSTFDFLGFPQPLVFSFLLASPWQAHVPA